MERPLSHRLEPDNVVPMNMINSSSNMEEGGLVLCDECSVRWECDFLKTLYIYL